jgi:hypothetical protein
MAERSPFGALFEQLIPAIGSAIYQWNIGTEPIREYYDPVLGLGEPEQFKQLVGNLRAAVRGAVSDLPDLPKIPNVTGNYTPRQVLLGERGDLAVANFLQHNVEQPAQQIGSFLGNIDFGKQWIEQLFRPSGDRKGPFPGSKEDEWQRRHKPPDPNVPPRWRGFVT